MFFFLMLLIPLMIFFTKSIYQSYIVNT